MGKFSNKAVRKSRYAKKDQRMGRWSNRGIRS